MRASWTKLMGFSVTPKVENQIWSDLSERFDQTSFWNMRILLVGCDGERRSWMRNSLRQIGVRVVAVAPNVTQLVCVADMSKSFTHVIVNLDGFNSMDDAVDALLDFRKRAPDVVVIAGSSQVAGDDFGMERSAICDVTLRIPATERRLRKSLLTGCENRLEAQRAERITLE
jgi:hypothetical protein